MVARTRKDGQSEEKSEIALEKHPVDEIRLENQETEAKIDFHVA